jgi:hypothetical protein
MWGAAAHDRATGVHQPLTATAMVLQPLRPADGDPGGTVIVALDHCLLFGKEMTALRQSVASRCNLSDDALLITFSHTHAAGLMSVDRVGLPGGDLIPDYLHRLADSVSSIVSEATGRTQPATITYGTGAVRLGTNRDFWDAGSGQYVCGYNPGAAGDDTVLVARVCGDGNRTIATIVNYACHPTTLAWQNTLISPDYPGAMREVVEQATQAPCVFLQGASGDIGPRDGYVGDVRTAERNGQTLGYAALSALHSLPPPATRLEYTGPVVSGATLGTWAHVPLDEEARAARARWNVRRFVVELPYRDDLPTLEQARSEQQRWLRTEQNARESDQPADAIHARAMAERMTRVIGRLTNLPTGDAFPLPVTVCRAGDACWVLLEGEHYNLLQRSLRERFANIPIVVATLTNGARATYLPTRESYGKGIYQESIALVAPGSLEQVIEAVAGQMAGLFGSGS